MDLGLAGKTALVTGGSRGIGRAVVERLLEEGMTVAFCARTEEGVQDAQLALGHRAIGGVANASDDEALAEWAEGAIAELGGVDVVISNASARGGIPNDPAGWHRV